MTGFKLKKLRYFIGILISFLLLAGCAVKLETASEEMMNIPLSGKVQSKPFHRAVKGEHLYPPLLSASWCEYVNNNLVVVTPWLEKIFIFHEVELEESVSFPHPVTVLSIPSRFGPGGEDLFSREIISSFTEGENYWLDMVSNYITEENVMTAMKELIRINLAHPTEEGGLTLIKSHATGMGEVLKKDNFYFAASLPQRFLSMTEDKGVLSVLSKMDMGEPIALKIRGQTAYVVSLHQGLSAVDISDPMNLVLKDRVGDPVLFRPWTIEIEGETAYIVTNSGFCLIDISQADNLALIGKWNREYRGDTWGMGIRRGNYYVILRKGPRSKSRYFEVIDISDPRSPRSAGEFPIEGSKALLTNYLTLLPGTSRFMTNCGEIFTLTQEGVPFPESTLDREYNGREQQARELPPVDNAVKEALDSNAIPSPQDIESLLIIGVGGSDTHPTLDLDSEILIYLDEYDYPIKAMTRETGALSCSLVTFLKPGTYHVRDIVFKDYILDPDGRISYNTRVYIKQKEYTAMNRYLEENPLTFTLKKGKYTFFPLAGGFYVSQAEKGFINYSNRSDSPERSKRMVEALLESGQYDLSGWEPAE